MNKWNPTKFFTIFANWKRGISYKCVKHGMSYNKAIASNVPFTKYVFSSLFPTLFILKAITNENKSAPNQKILNEADNLYDATQYDQLYSFLESHHGTEDPEILWRIARAIFEKARTVAVDKEKVLFYEQALAFVDKALENNEQCWAAHKWKAILLDYVWKYKSTKERIIHSFDIKKHMKRAIELNPEDGTSHYILGEWCYTFADMPWYQRKVAAALFASPPTSTYEEALQCFETAEKAQPLFYSMNLVMMAKCHLKLNNKEQALIFLNMVEKYPNKTPDDQKAHEEADKILKDLKI